MALIAGVSLFATSCSSDEDPVNNPGDGGEDTYVLDSDITENVTLETGKTYTLNGGVHVKSGATLTIQPGVTIVAQHDETVDYILIEQGAKIDAQGTAAQPIVMTSEKKEAGAALLAVCKDMKAVDAAMDIGNYQGFNMRIQFDSWSKEFILSVKHESVAKVRLGADALGNITRINNLLESYPEKLAEAEQRLETVQEQMTNAKEEVGKPFPKEEELNQKLERLSELNALLNMDEREDTETEQSESKEKEERPARGSIHEKLQIYKEKSQRESETGKENRKRDFGLE